MSAGFTPGPWANEYSDADEAIFVSAGAWPYGSTICEVDLKQKPREGGNEANACLIAAAPDMFEALERCANFIANTESEMGVTLESGQLARAALAKARGKA